MAKSPTPCKDVALLALNGSDYFAGDMLEEVIAYAFDQLCFRRSTPELEAILARLGALVAEDA